MLPSAAEARQKVLASTKRNLDEERIELLEKIGRVIANADCLCVNYEVPHEHRDSITAALELEGYMVIPEAGISSSAVTNLIISFEE